MTSSRPPTNADTAELRARAEERLRAREAAASSRAADEADALRLLHELQVHQIELELQNAELERTRDELESTLERYTDLYDFAPVGYLSLARDGGIYSANLAGSDLLGVPRARLLGRRFGTFLSLAERAGFDAFLSRTLDNTQRESCEVTVEPAGGGKRIVRIEATAAPSGKECSAALLDVTAQRAAEAEVRRIRAGLETAVHERTTELEGANRELEAFVQCISHDLRAPLRAIAGFSQALVEDLGDQLPAPAGDYLARIRAGGQRMGAVIDDLMKLSRIGRSDLEVASVDLAGPRREVLADLPSGGGSLHEGGAPVLLVEDNPDDVFLARRALQRCRVPAGLVVAGTGEEALAHLFQDRDGPLPSAAIPVLVLLDLQLPGIDGIEVLRRIRADSRTRTVPVVILSSSRAQSDVTACYELGANGFVQKDVDFDRFQECMGTLTEYWLRVNVPPVPPT